MGGLVDDVRTFWLTFGHEAEKLSLNSLLLDFLPKNHN